MIGFVESDSETGMLYSVHNNPVSVGKLPLCHAPYQNSARYMPGEIESSLSHDQQGSVGNCIEHQEKNLEYSEK
jgi:hypothetical protein